MFLGLAWCDGDDETAARVETIDRRLDAEGGWAPAARGAGLRLRSARPGSVRRLASSDALILGDFWPAIGGAGAVAATPRRACAETVFRELLRLGWGRYVAILPRPGQAPAVLRDPSGCVDCVVWRLGRLTVIAADILAAPPWLRPARLAMDWSRVRRLAASPAGFGLELPFSGVEALAPGAMLALGEESGPTPLWTPAGLFPGGWDPAEAQVELARRLDHCVDALASRYEGLVVEVSGGLDSALVAGALEACGALGRVRQWINYRGDRPEGDESARARAVTGRLGVRLVEAPMAVRPLEAADFAELARGMRPALNALDPDRDRDGAARLAASGAGAIVSGQGGDAVLFQMPTALVAADHLHEHGLAGLPDRLAAVARRTRRSSWSVLGEAVSALRPQARLAPLLSSLASPAARAAAAAAPHPWVAAPGGLPPAKRLQVRALANAQQYLGACRRTAAGDLVYPLLAQPVVELCLGLSATVLAGAEQDRAWARAAFAARLPPEVMNRRSKGDVTSFYGRTVAASLDFLRPHLLEGCLTEAGVLDRAALEDLLAPEALIRGGDTGAVLAAAATESWVRYWQGRVPDAVSRFKV